jgi:hypothetical protein
VSRFDYSRPRFRTEGRTTESITGDGLPDVLRAPPRIRPSREAQRADADAAMRAYIAAGKTVKRLQPDAQPTRPGAIARRPNADRPVVKPTQSDEPPPW